MPENVAFVCTDAWMHRCRQGSLSGTQVEKCDTCRRCKKLNPKHLVTNNEENKALFKYNPLTSEVCRKTELGEGTDLRYRNDACVPFREEHMRNYKTVSSGRCKSAKCAQLWRKFNGGNTGKPDWTVCSAVYYTCLTAFDLSGVNCNQQLETDPSRYTAKRECLQAMDIEHWRINGKGNPTSMSKKTRTEWINTEMEKGVYPPAAK